MKVRIYAGEACFGESVGIRGRFGRALLGRVEPGWDSPGVRENPAEPHRYKLMTIGDSGNLG